MGSSPGWSFGTSSNNQDRPHEPVLPPPAALPPIGPPGRAPPPAAYLLQLPVQWALTPNHWRAASPVAPFAEASGPATLLRSVANRCDDCDDLTRLVYQPAFRVGVRGSCWSGARVLSSAGGPARSAGGLGSSRGRGAS